MKELWLKIREALISVLPITLLVYLLALIPDVSIEGNQMIAFTMGAVSLVFGIGFFNMGADIAMTPLITIQLLGFKAVVSNQLKERRTRSWRKCWV